MNWGKYLPRRDGTAPAVTITRRFADETLTGRVLDVGRKWVLLTPVEDDGKHHGFVVIRRRDVLSVKKDKRVLALASAKEPLPVPPPLNLDKTSVLLRQCGKKFALVGIEREKKVPDCLWIGVPVLVDNGWLFLHEISDRATWHKWPLAYRQRTITKIQLDVDYLQTLTAIAPKRPPRTVVCKKEN